MLTQNLSPQESVRRRPSASLWKPRNWSRWAFARPRNSTRNAPRSFRSSPARRSWTSCCRAALRRVPSRRCSESSGRGRLSCATRWQSLASCRSTWGYRTCTNFFRSGRFLCIVKKRFSDFLCRAERENVSTSTPRELSGRKLTSVYRFPSDKFGGLKTWRIFFFPCTT